MSSHNTCQYCDYGQDSDRRCMNSRSQWAGVPVKPDNYCGLFALSGNMSLTEFRKYLIDLSVDGLNGDVMAVWDLLIKRQENMLHELPVPMGGTLFMVVRNVHNGNKVSRRVNFVKRTQLMRSNYFRVLDEFGRTFFLTREEAIAELRNEVRR